MNYIDLLLIIISVFLYFIPKTVKLIKKTIKLTEQTFPCRDVEECSIAAKNLIEKEFNTLLQIYMANADIAWREKDYKSHTIYSMAANQLIVIRTAPSLLIAIKKSHK